MTQRRFEKGQNDFTAIGSRDGPPCRSPRTRRLPNWSLLAKFDGEFANGSQLYAGSGTLRYTW
jgi:hypothetical protein